MPTTNYSFSAPTFSVSEAGVSAAVTISRTGETTAAGSVKLETTNGTATAGADYTDSTGTANFLANQTTVTVYVPITNDSIIDPGEYLNLSLSSAIYNGAPAGYGSHATATLAIDDDDDAGIFSFSASTHDGYEGLGGITITVTRTPRPGMTLTTASVKYGTSDDTASSLSDYTSTSGTLTFSGTDNSMTFFVPFVNDSLVETTEYLNLSLTSPTNGGTVSLGCATVSIIDNDYTAGPTLYFMEGVFSDLQFIYSFTPTTSLEDITTGVDWGAGEADSDWTISRATEAVILLDEELTGVVIYGSHRYVVEGEYQYELEVVVEGSLLDRIVGAAVVQPFEAVDDSVTMSADTVLLSGQYDDDGLFGLFFNDGARPADLSLVSYTQPDYGTVTVGSDGEFVYTPPAQFTGQATFTYEVEYGSTLSTATVTIDVDNFWSPTANDDQFIIDTNYSSSTVYSLSSDTVFLNDADGDGQELSITSYTQPAYGQVTLETDGTFTYQPNGNFQGDDSFTYTIFDGFAPSTGTVRISTAAFLGLSPAFDPGNNILCRFEEFETPGDDGLEPVSTEGGRGPATYSANLWETLSKDVKRYINEVDVLKGGWQVHHAAQQGGQIQQTLANKLWETFKQDVHAADNLYYVPAHIHSEITNRQTEWWGAFLTDNKAKFKDLQDAFANASEAQLKTYLKFTEGLTDEFKPFMIPRDGTVAHVNQLRSSLKLDPWVPGANPRGSVFHIRAQNTFRQGEQSRLAAIAKVCTFEKAICVAGIYALFSNGAAVAGNIANPPPHVTEQFGLMVPAIGMYANSPNANNGQNLAEKVANYLNALELDPAAVNGVRRILYLKMGI